MDNLWLDIRYGLRMLRKNPTFTIVAVLTLALGIGVNSVVFSIVDAILLRPLPVERPDQLVKINAGEKEGFNELSSYVDYMDFRNQTKTMSGMIAYGGRGAVLEIFGQKRLLPIMVVSSNYFQVLGVKAMMGRTFDDSSDVPHGPPAVVISYGAWQSLFGGNTEAIGRSIRINEKNCILLGVAPKNFRGTSLMETRPIWMPLGTFTLLRGEEQTNRGYRWFELMGRLRPGVTVRQAQVEIETIARRLALEYPATNAHTRATVIAESKSRGSEVSTFSAIILVISSLVLLIACANVSNLLLSRSVTRHKEIAMRLALGARPGRLIRQLLTEGLLLTLLGLVSALILSSWLIKAIPSTLGTQLTTNIVWDFRLDERVLLFTLATSVIAVLLFALAPAIRATQTDLAPALRNLTSSSKSRRYFHGWSLRDILVIQQMAISLLLLIGTGLLVKTLWNTQNVKLGFQKKEMLLFWFLPGELNFRGDQLQVFYRELLERVEALPGVRKASLVQRAPLYPDETGQTQSVSIPGYELPPGTKAIPIRYTIVWPNYFEVMGTRIVQGRAFNSQDEPNGPGIVIINQSMANRFWPGQSAVGKRVQVSERNCEVIGVAEDGKYVSLREDPFPYLYLPIAQWPSSDMTLLVHSLVPDSGLVDRVRGGLRDLAKSIPEPMVTTQEELLRLAAYTERVTVELAGGLCMLAVTLALIGLYGLMSWFAKRQTREIGIRIALGATPRKVMKLILMKGFSLALAGLAIGFVLAPVVTRLLASQLFGVRPSDLSTYLTSAFLLFAVALAACFLPARRAMRVDPMMALRYE